MASRACTVKSMPVSEAPLSARARNVIAWEAASGSAPSAIKGAAPRTATPSNSAAFAASWEAPTTHAAACAALAAASRKCNAASPAAACNSPSGSPESAAAPNAPDSGIGACSEGCMSSVRGRFGGLTLLRRPPLGPLPLRPSPNALAAAAAAVGGRPRARRSAEDRSTGRRSVGGRARGRTCDARNPANRFGAIRALELFAASRPSAEWPGGARVAAEDMGRRAPSGGPLQSGSA
mmetsp:Transcript_35383/g.110317  ORF Transcript_35383/g.110317 Transcript_35383/m.110317 type:complete len:236 (-) Transcript_35383:75-782(-)